MIDTTTLKERVDLFDLVSRDAQLRKVAASEFPGPAPSVAVTIGCTWTARPAGGFVASVTKSAAMQSNTCNGAMA